ncbi:glycoside hydrolase family 2 TIM barrel-domain containing protein [Arcanobacterium phocae]|uniref:glycoside hydrolase family 2 TIM barrel-domain containing protein n=1 Tax=Arcanobacterium phocae TaxID=131112 RepID=UPI001C10866A|nr:glycoside hydrolase family 2 TIM barrel-domain containing protein [Arcanobacterium phocae]
MSTPQHIEEISASTGFLVPPRTWRPASDYPHHISLNGEWRFRLHPTAQLDDSLPWETITLPCHWVFSSERDDAGRLLWTRGKPIYTNQKFPFALNPPHVPQDNPTGEHVRTFNVSAQAFADVATGGRAIIRFLGVESIAQVRVNDVLVATLRGSRLMHEVDISSAIQEGTNIISVVVSQWSAMSYIEDQDQWWLAGIFRDVDFYVERAGSFRDARVHGDYDPHTGVCTLHIRVESDGDTYTCRIGDHEHVLRTGRWESVVVESALPWSPDAPHLYPITLTNSVDARTIRVGFRRVEVFRGKRPRILLNGKKLELRGVNRHETHPDKGRAFDPDQLRRDLTMMKRHNINAIRTAHYPHDPRFYDLADEFGFWVVCEVDLETHGFVFADWAGNPSDSPQWRGVYEDRALRTVSRDYNHPSIIIWSLGNESGYGENMARSAALIRREDPSRPIHYEGDYDGRITDIHSRMYLPIEQIHAMCSPGGDVPISDVAVWGHVHQFPLINCEYAHAMGNSPGALIDYDECIERYEQYHGGFVWEWRDHGLRTWDNGQEYFGYGGDFGERTHDSNFVMDGLVRSDGVPSPALAELKAVYAPVKLVARAEPGRLIVDVRNRYHAQRSRILTTRVYVGETCLGVLEHDVAPGERETLVWEHDAISPEAVIDLVSCRNEVPIPGNVWEEEGWEVSRTQVRPQVQPLRYPVGGVIEPATEPLVKLDGDRLIRILELPVADIRPSLWRAPTDNDESRGFGSFSLASPGKTFGAGLEGAPSSADLWRAAGLDKMVCHEWHTELSGDEYSGRYVREEVWASDQSQARVNVTWRWEWGVVDGEPLVRLSADVMPSASCRGSWPRTGIHFAIPRPEHVSWYGYGPGEAYSDSRQAVTLGHFAAEPQDLEFEYSVPQENGTRIGMRELVLSYNSYGVRLHAHPHISLPEYSDYYPSFSLHEQDEFALTAARHPYELEENDGFWHLYLDGGQHGLGSRTCGPDVYPQHAWTPRVVTISLDIKRHTR